MPLLNYVMMNENELACKRAGSRVSRTVARNAIFINVKYFIVNLARSISFTKLLARVLVFGCATFDGIKSFREVPTYISL